MTAFKLIRDNETDASHCLTLSMAQHAAIQFAACKPLAEIDEACLDALSAVVTAELQVRDAREGSSMFLRGPTGKPILVKSEFWLTRWEKKFSRAKRATPF